MNAIQVVRGNLPEIIRNDSGLYKGDLKEYFKIIFRNSRNLNHPYHNFRHMTHVPWLCHQACEFYENELSAQEMRELLIAGLFHDFDHTGLLGNDDVNIIIAVRGIEKYILEEDRESLPTITQLIKATEYPYTIPSEELDLRGHIIRDADLSQALSVAWIQQVVIGLAKEWNQQPIDVLKIQGPFLNSLKFTTDWAKEMFPQKKIDEKIEEARELFEIVK